MRLVAHDLLLTYVLTSTHVQPNKHSIWREPAKDGHLFGSQAQKTFNIYEQFEKQNSTIPVKGNVTLVEEVWLENELLVAFGSIMHIVRLWGKNIAHQLQPDMRTEPTRMQNKETRV